MITHGAHYLPILCRELGGDIDPDTVCIADTAPDGTMRAVFGFSGWSDGDIEGMLWARPGGLSRALLTACAGYVFGQLACDRLTIRIQGDNAAMLNLAPRIGFTKEGTMRAAHQGREVHIFGMLRGECRWLRTRSQISEEAKGAQGT